MASNAACTARVVVALTLLLNPLGAAAQSSDSEQPDLTGITASATTRATDTPHDHQTLLRAAITHLPLAQSPSSRSSGRWPCGKKVLVGLGIGAGTGLAYGLLVGGRVDEPGKFKLATTTLFGLIGAAVGFRLCR
jgi:hypothetical protein